nr:MAG TPA: hypothetical protein [Caudoviricetes sp.]
MRLCARGKVEIYSRLTMPAGFTAQQPGGTRATTIQRKWADHHKVVELIPSGLQC